MGRFATGGVDAGDVVGGFAGALRQGAGDSNIGKGSGGGGGGGLGGGGGGGGPIRSTVSAGQGLGGFLATTAREGLDAALRARGLERVVGKPVAEVVSALVDDLAGNGGPLDDAIARAALTETLVALLDDPDGDYSDLKGALDGRLDSAAISDLLALFISKALFERLLSELGERLEAKGSSATRIQQKEKEIEDYLNAMVRFEMGEIDPLNFDWAGADGQALLERNLGAALAQLEI